MIIYRYIHFVFLCRDIALQHLQYHIQFVFFTENFELLCWYAGSTQYENPKHYQDIWITKSNGDPIFRSEIFASHIENQIRAQSGYPLRKYYGLSKDVESGRQFGLKGTLLLDGNNNSLYFKQTEPSIFTIQNRGEIINQKIEQIKRKDGRYDYNN